MQTSSKRFLGTASPAGKRRVPGIQVPARTKEKKLTKEKEEKYLAENGFKVTVKLFRGLSGAHES